MKKLLLLVFLLAGCASQGLTPGSVASLQYEAARMEFKSCKQAAWAQERTLPRVVIYPSPRDLCYARFYKMRNR